MELGGGVEGMVVVEGGRGDFIRLPKGAKECAVMGSAWTLIEGEDIDEAMIVGLGTKCRS